MALAQGPPDPASTPAPDEWIRRLGTLPLMHQPGASWMYNTGSDVLGVLIARAAGQPFETFLRERIFEPAGHERHRLQRARRRGSTAWSPATGPTPPRARSTWPTNRPAGSGARRRRSRRAAAASCPPSTTTSPSPRCCWPAAGTGASASSRGRRSS